METLSNASRNRLTSLFFRRLPAAGLAVCIALAIAPSQLWAQLYEEPAVVARRIQLEPMLTAELQRVVNKQKRIEGQGKDVTVKAYFETSPPGGIRLIVDLSESYVPSHTAGDFEDLRQELDNVVYWILREDVPYEDVKFLFGGKDIYHYFPEERMEFERSMEGRKRASLRPASGNVVVAAGHGIYFHHGFKDWRTQRDPSNGIIEDFITRDYADELSKWLIERSNVAPLSPRTASASSHEPSGDIWWRMAARYNLEATYPDAPEMWHSLPNNTSGDRERREDILARPLFANHVSASTIFHLHTNASDSSDASGARVYVYNDKTADKALGDNVLCYMKEVIQAQDPYENYVVDGQARTGNHGENRLANMPSIIVESGFHTNPSDAAALQDPVFRMAAMKGVEKGYRLHSEGVGCEPLKISETPDASGPFGTLVPMEVHYEGHPQFPVTVKIDIANCPIGSTCRGGYVPFSEKGPSPLRYAFECSGTSDTPVTARLLTTLIDIDDVKAVSTEHEVTCTPSGRIAPVLAPKDSSRPSLTVGAS